MKPRKPDRFERAVEEIIKSDRDVGYDAICFPFDVIKLLRNEHAWMMKQIRAVGKVRFADGLYKVGVDSALEELRFRLTQRRK